MKKSLSSFFILVAITSMVASITAQSGGSFVITKSVIAGGGGNSNGGTFNLSGTIGQSLAGVTSTGGSFSVVGGFWNAPPLPASSVTISGRVTTPFGLNLSNARVSLIDPLGVRRTAVTSPFGLFSFENVMTGVNYTISVASKRYRFAPQTRLVQSSLTNVNFIGLE